MHFKLPDNHSRTLVLGATGSGKTRFGIWLLAKQDYLSQPWVIIDYKGDDLIEQITRAREISLKEIPKNPGVYLLRPEADDPEIERWLLRVKERGGIGVYFDEGYMVPSMPPRYKALNRILTQGRSLKIPVIILSQRPAWLTRFARSEASYFAVFRMQDENDYKTIQGFIPRNTIFDFNRRLPPYYSRWYDVARDYSCVLKPVPSDDEIVELFDRRLRSNVVHI